MQDWLNELLNIPIFKHKSCNHKLLTIRCAFTKLIQKTMFSINY